MGRKFSCELKNGKIVKLVNSFKGGCKAAWEKIGNVRKVMEIMNALCDGRKNLRLQ